jgi:hypothetical protein
MSRRQRQGGGNQFVRDVFRVHEVKALKDGQRQKYVGIKASAGVESTAYRDL